MKIGEKNCKAAVLYNNNNGKWPRGGAMEENCSTQQQQLEHKI